MIKQHDFIEIDYTAMLAETKRVFDTTDEKVADKENIKNPNTKYGPAIICVGEHQVPPGLDTSFIGKKLESYQITLIPEAAFGKKNPKLLQLVSQSSFKKQNLMPYPGLQVNLDGMTGIIRTVTPGRVIVDFNHPLAGKEILYKIKILRKVTNSKEKLDSLLAFYSKNFTSKFKEGQAEITANIPDQAKNILKQKITTLIPSIKKITIKKE